MIITSLSVFRQTLAADRQPLPLPSLSKQTPWQPPSSGCADVATVLTAKSARLCIWILPAKLSTKRDRWRVFAPFVV